MIFDFNILEKDIEETREHFSKELSNIRTGRAAPMLLDTVRFEVYGARTALRDIASISVEDARTLRVALWDTSLIKVVEKGIIDADLGVSVAVDDQGLRIIFPDLTAERREMLVKLIKEKLEQSKVAIRHHRTETIKKIDALSKSDGVGKDEIFSLKEDMKKYIDTGIESLETLASQKQREISL